MTAPLTPSERPSIDSFDYERSDVPEEVNRYISELISYTNKLADELETVERHAEAVERRLAEANKRIAELETDKDDAYRQRNYLVAALARLFPSGVRNTNIPGWADDWHGCCFINLPSGQISYHFHDSHRHLFAGLPPYESPWDGHEKETVHNRLLAISTGYTAKSQERAETAERQLADARHQQHLAGVFADKQREEYKAVIARYREKYGELE